MSRSQVQVQSHREQKLLDEFGVAKCGYENEESAAADEKSPVRLQRDILQISTAGMVLFGLHLKSKGNPPWQCVAADDIRLLEARAVAQVVSLFHTEHRERAAMILGDFNDVAGSPSLVPIDALGWMDLHGDHYAKLGRNPSTYWPKRRMRLDRMLVTPDTVGKAVPGSAVIHTGEL